MEAALAAELKETYHVTNPPPPPPPSSNPLTPLAGIFLLLVSVAVMESGSRLHSVFLIPNHDSGADCQRERGTYSPVLRISVSPSSLPLPLVSVRVYMYTAAPNCSNGRRRQTTCGKSFSNS